MALKQETIRLGGFDYVCTALTSRVGLRVAARITNALAPALAGAGSLEHATKGTDGEDALDSLGAMLAPVLSNPALSDTLDYLIDTFAACTLVRASGAEEGGAPLARTLDVQFSDSYDDLLAWLLFSIKLSLSSFFRGARGLGVLLAQAGQASKSPSSAEKTGQSGA